MAYRHTLLTGVHSEFEFQVVQSNQSTTFDQCTEVSFADFPSGGFITAILVNPPERKLAKRTSVIFIRYSISPVLYTVAL